MARHDPSVSSLLVPDRLLKVAQVARILSVSKKRVYTMRRMGLLSGVALSARNTRITTDSLIVLLKQRGLDPSETSADLLDSLAQ